MDGLVPGRIVYFVFDGQRAAEAMRRRTTGKSIADRMTPHACAVPGGGPDVAVYGWPAGAQAHIGNDVNPGDILPAMVLRVLGESGCSNLKVQLDGADEFWATSISYDAAKTPGTWHWMFDGQQRSYQAPTPKISEA
jgi:hypothetical protein